MPKHRIIYLADRFFNESATLKEKEELAGWIEESKNDDKLRAVLETAWMNYLPSQDAQKFADKFIPRIQQVINKTITEKEIVAHKKSSDKIQAYRNRDRKIHLLKTAWFRYAAAIIMLFGIGAYLYLTSTNKKEIVTTAHIIKNDIPPGKDKAILTLSDGSSIILDGVADGKLTDQGDANIIKKGNELIYTLPEQNAAGDDKIIYNTMRTPRGGQYKLTLPDGTKVWLNAASSITYPTVFTRKERRVNITGEVYFEVMRNAAIPFYVEHGDVDIKVIGTKFNVNAYDDEAVKKITLLEGSVNVNKEKINKENKNNILKPAQQAQITDSYIRIADNVDIETVMAWKNGLFRFNNTNIEDIMRQVSRWYDVEIEYKGNFADLNFGGFVSRQSNVSALLKRLEATQAVRFKLEERKIIVSKY